MRKPRREFEKTLKKPTTEKPLLKPSWSRNIEQVSNTERGVRDFPHRGLVARLQVRGHGIMRLITNMGTW